MKNRWMLLTQAALCGIAGALSWAAAAPAQQPPPGGGGAAGAGGTPGADDGAECTPSREPHECAERCPDYDTCFLADEPLLYYRVGDQRFDCDGLDCNAASTRLGDYCCRRGDYAPQGGGGGCSAVSGAGALAGQVALALGALAIAGSARRRARHGGAGRR